jgi:hypothetical protein
VEYVERKNIDLIVMGTRGRSGFKRLLLGSTASGVVTYAHCPVHSLLMKKLFVSTLCITLAATLLVANTVAVKPVFATSGTSQKYKD